MKYEIQFTPDEPEDYEEALEFRKNEIANATDYTPGMAESISGLTWSEIFRACGY